MHGVSENLFGVAGTEEQARQWLASYEQHGRDLVAQAQQVGEELQNATETVTSKNGAVTVTVGASGALLDAQFTDKARNLSPSDLAATLMDTVRTAQAQVAHQVADTVAPLAGDGDTMEFIRSQLPPLQEQDAESARRSDGSDDDSDDDFSNETFLR